MSLIDKTGEKRLDEEIDEIYKDIENFVKKAGFIYRYSGPSCAGIVVRIRGMTVWKEKPRKSILDYILHNDRPLLSCDALLDMDFDMNTVSLYDEEYKDFAENICTLLKQKKRLEEKRRNR